jgi:xylulokinase
MAFLGIDIGAAAVKAILTDAETAVVAEETVPVATARPRPGWAEQDPAAWWAATVKAVASLRRADAERFAAVRGIGLTGQMQALVILDEADAPVRPAILWNDLRAVSECALLARQVPELAAIAGGGAVAGHAAAKLLWLRDHEPDAFERIRTVMSAKDYVRLRLTGERATDASDASATLMFDQVRRRWSPELAAASGIDEEMLPPVLEGPAWSGMLAADVLAEFGFDHEVVVAAGAGNVAAGAVGIGAVRNGDAFIWLGPTAQICVARDRYRLDAKGRAHTLAHAVPGRWLETGPLINGTACLDWLAGIVDARDANALIAKAQEAFAGPSAVLFLPYLAGERALAGDAAQPGAFGDLDPSVGSPAMTQAVLEGIALALKDAEEAFGDNLPAGPMPIIGSGARSALWLLILASVLGRPLMRLAVAETAPALGAARLARIAAAGHSVEGAGGQPAALQVVDPLPELSKAYAERREDFFALAQSLRGIMPAPAARAGRRQRAKR